MLLTSWTERLRAAVFVVPANTRDWPAGPSFYEFDKLYDSRNLGYRGPEFGYAPCPTSTRCPRSDGWIEYSLRTLISFVATNPDPSLDLVVVGDHQPHSYVTGERGGHDVPISIIARDPVVMDRISGWGWQPDLLPGPDAPVWRMDRFRNRFLRA